MVALTFPASPRSMEDLDSGLANEAWGASQTAQYLIKIDTLMTSTVTGYTSYAVAQGWRLSVKNTLHGYMAGPVQPRQPTVVSPLEVMILFGEYIPSLLNAIAIQKTIAEVDLVLMATLNKADVPLVTIKLTNAYLEDLNMSTDFYPYFLLKIRYKAISITYAKVAQDKLTSAGNKVFSYDLTTNAATAT